MKLADNNIFLQFCARIKKQTQYSDARYIPDMPCAYCGQNMLSCSDAENILKKITISNDDGIPNYRSAKVISRQETRRKEWKSVLQSGRMEITFTSKDYPEAFIPRCSLRWDPWAGIPCQRATPQLRRGWPATQGYACPAHCKEPFAA